ncbi:MAG: sugar-binding protein [Sedimentisphaerales bacterium]|nr:sugar-binding protein [Sedimentisphaerales bacterium]
MKKTVFTCLMVLALCLGIILPGCSKKKADKAVKTKLAFITNNTANFWVFARRGCEKAAGELPEFEVDFRITSDATPAEQRRIIDDLLARGVQGIAISPVDPLNQKPFIDELAGKITVITCDSDIPGSRRKCYIGTDNVAAGRQAGEMIKEVLPRGGKIMLFVGKQDTQNAKERIQGIKEAIAGTKIEVIDVRTDNVDQVRAKSNVADSLVTYPDLSCCVGLWNYNGPAILNAVADAGKLGQVKIVCFDENEETLTGVRDGHIYGTVVQQPYEFGYRSMRVLADIIKGNDPNVPPDGMLIVPTIIIKKDNVSPFIEKVHELLKK